MLDLGAGALMHDVGKLDLPDRVRHREDHFSAAEQRLYEEHVAFGLARARKMKLTQGATLVVAAPRACRRSGFPLKLSTDHVAAGARRRAGEPLRQPLQPARHRPRADAARALSMLFAQSKTKFDRHPGPSSR